MLELAGCQCAFPSSNRFSIGGMICVGNGPFSGMAHWRRHAFFCPNQRRKGEPGSARLNAQTAFDRRKAEIRGAGLDGVRTNRSSCLGRGTDGPVAVVCPQGTWYTSLDSGDIVEFVSAERVPPASGSARGPATGRPSSGGAPSSPALRAPSPRCAACPALRACTPPFQSNPRSSDCVP